MRVETVAVGGPRAISWNGREVLTSIFKSPVAGPVAVRRHNLEGDRQSDPSVHGGEYKAVYAYAAEHYDWWKSALGRELEPANFGENLTIREFDDGRVAIGDVFRVGSAALEAVAPRLPCSKLGLRFGDVAMVKTFAQARRWGIYFRVVEEGSVCAGDPVERIHSDPERLTVYDLARVFLFDRGDRETIRRLAGHERIDPETRRELAERLEAR
ncbi:MAG: MOSC domain-containing protein [Acidobacteriota bacterium]|nr:MOSC domain-containing protein [Acidobacteriota bacterium]MDQ5872265.1 MOSC domain-containing protein [Acidobacteriota bacterium]